MPVSLASSADPFALYARLRKAAPVHRLTLPGGAAVWLVTRYDDVRSGLADPRLSLCKVHARGWTGLSLPAALDANLLNMDPPGHTRVRRLVASAFHPRRVAEMRPRVRAVADALLDAIAPLGRADLVGAFAAPLPIAVISELFGIPAGDRDDFRAWTNAMLRAESAADRAELGDAVAKIHRFLLDLVDRKRSDPGDDLVSAMIVARDDGDRLSENELVSLSFLVLFAGYENTVNLIGNGVLALLAGPERLAELRSDPGLLPAVVEEALRYDPPAPVSIRRFPIEDVEIGGVRIPAGETVLLGLASANRDPARFGAPDSFVPGRADNAHLSFGHGIHFCIGAALARLEGQVAIAGLLERFPRLALDGPVERLRWLESFRTRSLVELPVTF